MSANKFHDEKNHPFWLTKGNYHKSLFDMTDQYLLSTLEKCIRDQWRLSMIPFILDELVSRGYRKTHPELFI